MRKAEEDRFREFARGHVTMLRRSAYLLCGDWHLADDLVQTALIKMHRAWPRVTRTDRPISFARKTLLRCWLDERRRPWRRAERFDDSVPDGADDGADPVVAAQRRETRAELFQVLSEVAPRQRAVLVLRYFEGLSVAETAEALGCSEGTVKSQAARGLAVMKAAFGVETAAATTALRSE
jgi:RNA polymerase sigma-70 factor (sigma-E family)